MKINFNDISLNLKQINALASLVENNIDFVESLSEGTYTCFTHALGMPQNLVGAYYFEVQKVGESITLKKARIQ